MVMVRSMEWGYPGGYTGCWVEDFDICQLYFGAILPPTSNTLPSDKSVAVCWARGSGSAIPDGTSTGNLNGGTGVTSTIGKAIGAVITTIVSRTMRVTSAITIRVS